MAAEPVQTDAIRDRVEILFLTGQPGVGKTAVAKEISDLLWKLHEPHAVIEIDELARGVMPIKTPDFNRALAVANLKAIWANFYAAGVRRVILSRILETTDDLEQFSSAIPQAHLTVCILQAPAETVQERITGREPGSSRAFLLTLTGRIAERIDQLDIPCIRIQNGQRPVQEVAREILQASEWPCPGS